MFITVIYNRRDTARANSISFSLNIAAEDDP